MRYSLICADYVHEIRDMVEVYKGVMARTPAPRIVHFLARMLLRKVFTKEETEEISGIARNTGIPLHIVVAYNTFLDLFSGCISGGARVAACAGKSKVIHFRNLDWDMEPLRDMIIRVEYMIGGRVVARAVTYAGYIGVLTGVRKGLSMSLNYRDRTQSQSSTISNRIHQLFILLGKRPSISARLRQILLSPGPPPTLADLSYKFKHTTASPCYLTFCTPYSALVIEKDLNSALTHTSDTFLAVTNHDVAFESTNDQDAEALKRPSRIVRGSSGSMSLLNESIERKDTMYSLWRDRKQPSRPTKVQRALVNDVKTWLRTYPIRNECTHFCCIMDPSAEGGGLVWVESCEVSTGPNNSFQN
ncbi:N-acylethanolamine-hydrolyzing acid amidase [Psilocybe cubensis]|uniref:N-acylethanolamine-hydrolyzing acid amidase n=2 Tax=Psilocybe cubensis TaxID=181762 RepID=A0ACB8GW50_PSICU|nr:N-acylethanolamine-hydrolyzing acid amidase [Psilocybe cubensis]KAH9479829.1 N-acylethanolamine-hydrolyzing acid amidase [Psilocybe cubensis]